MGEAYTLAFLSATFFIHFSAFFQNFCHNEVMLPKILMKNPLLMIGILMMIIFLYQLKSKGYFTRTKLIPSSCRAVLVKLDRRIPSGWDTKCEGNNLAVSIPFTSEKKLQDKTKLRVLAYRELANHLVQIAKNSPSDNLERTDIVRVRLFSNNLEINAVTEGRFIVKLATIKTPKLLKEHLKNTVQVKETIK